MKAHGAAGADPRLSPPQTRAVRHKQTAASIAAQTCSIAILCRWREKGCLRVLCRNTARPAYAPMVPSKNAHISNVPSDTRLDPARARILSRPNSRKVIRLISANRPSALGRVRRVLKGMCDVSVG